MIMIKDDDDGDSDDHDWSNDDDCDDNNDEATNLVAIKVAHKHLPTYLLFRGYGRWRHSSCLSSPPLIDLHHYHYHHTFFDGIVKDRMDLIS